MFLYLSALTGPFRYEFFVGSLKGHSDPNDPWYPPREDQLQADEERGDRV